MTTLLAVLLTPSASAQTPACWLAEGVLDRAVDMTLLQHAAAHDDPPLQTALADLLGRLDAVRGGTCPDVSLTLTDLCEADDTDCEPSDVLSLPEGAHHVVGITGTLFDNRVDGWSVWLRDVPGGPALLRIDNAKHCARYDDTPQTWRLCAELGTWTRLGGETDTVLVEE